MNEFLDEVSNRLAQSLNPVAVSEQFVGFLEKLVVAGTTFLAFYLAWWLVSTLLRRFMAGTNVDETARRFVLTITKVVLLSIGVVQALAAIGIDTASLLTSLGIAGLTIGFAARDGLSNIISGVFIFWDRPFVIGDLIEADGHYGLVDDITLRATRVITPDGKMLSIPNSQMVNSTVASYTNEPHLRLDVGVTVGPSESVDRVRKLLLDIVLTDGKFLAKPAPCVRVVELGDYNISLELQAWIADERTHMDERFRLREKIYQVMVEAGVDMPFETISLTPVELKSV